MASASDAAASETANLLTSAQAEYAASIMRDSNMERAKGYVKMFTDAPADAPWKQALACFLKYAVKPLIIIAMVYIWIGKQLYKVYKILPMNILEMIFGAALCFFGGTYFCSIAAIEAFRNFGGMVLLEELTVIYEQGCLVADASAEDDKVDANKDGIADVNQMSYNDLITHKAKVAFVAVKEPEKLCNAGNYLCSAWISVLATLKFEFAKTLAIALGIADMLTPMAVKIFGSTLAMVMGKDLNHWVPAIIINSARIVAVVVASYIQAFISAFYSGLRGGKMFANGLFNILAEYNVLQKLPDCLVAKPFDPNQSYLDECIAYPLAAVGFWYQVSHGFALEFPYNLALLPLTIVEWILRWEVYTA